MHLKPIICSQCRARLTVDKSDDTVICPYCGTQFTLIKENRNNHYEEFHIINGILGKYNGFQKTVYVPEGVAVIAEGAFVGTSVQELYLPDSVMEIESRAFGYQTGFVNDQKVSKIKKIEMGKGLRIIRTRAFQNCNFLEEIDLPKSIELIEKYALPNSLKKLSIPSAWIGDPLVFGNCSKLTSVDGPPDFYDRLKKALEASGSDLDLIRHSPWYGNQTRTRWIELGRCSHCGGRFKGIFSQRCSYCGRRKDY